MDKMKLLLVDDEVEFVKTLTERIRMRGLEVHFAVSGESALTMIDREAPHVMVLDLKMPGMDGKAVLEQVIANHSDIQILILTGHGSEKEAEEMLRMGAFDYLQKPVDIDTLIAHINKAYQNWTDKDSQQGS
jgi:DNA-binding NtrC family response regulator